MSIGAGVVIAIALQQVDGAPHAEAGAEGDHKGLQNGNCAVKEIHINLAFCRCAAQKMLWKMKNAAVILRRLRPRRTNLFRICQRLHRALLLPGG